MTDNLTAEDLYTVEELTVAQLLSMWKLIELSEKERGGGAEQVVFTAPVVSFENTHGFFKSHWVLSHRSICRCLLRRLKMLTCSPHCYHDMVKMKESLDKDSALYPSVSDWLKLHEASLITNDGKMNDPTGGKIRFLHLFEERLVEGERGCDG